jgi:uracil-DNA glycosylase family 4
MVASPLPATEPPHDCPLCPRLVAFRAECRLEHPDWWNAPVPAWGDPDAWLAVIGLAPGKHGANRTGRPFTGDFAGELLYATLGAHGLATGTFRADPADDLRLTGSIIVNAVRCLPPANKPTPAEIRTCRPFLEAPLAALRHVRVLVALGQIAHDSAARALGLKASAAKFGHLAEHRLADANGRRRVLIDSYHCSRYNQNTGKLTVPMFQAVFTRALELRKELAAAPHAVGR